jgi:hypothetical protein
MKPRSAAAIACLLSVLALSPSASATPPASSQPGATIEPATASVGQLVRVTGNGWGSDVSEVVQVAECGNAALNGMIDCDVANTAEGGVREDGSFFAGIVVRAPVLPCPCALRLSSVGTTAVVTVPIEIVGAPVAQPVRHPTAERRVAIRDVRLAGTDSVASWFGAHAHRVLTFRVTNSGQVALKDPAIQITWGKGARPTGFVNAPAIGLLAVNATKTFRVAIPFTAGAIGRYHARVQIDPLGVSSEATAATSTYPWGLLVCFGLCLALVGRRFLGRFRRRPISAQTTQRAGAGWYVDPVAGDRLRLWDGRTWTANTRRLTSPPPRQETLDREAGWYRDPERSDGLRLWDGTAWTDQVRNDVPVSSGSRS